MGYGYATCSEGRPGQPGDRAIWWSTYSLQTCPDDWRQLDRDAARRQLQARHASWKNASVQSLIADVEVESLYPTFITPLLPTWSNGGCALVGDAAHALQPSSGQGASMALEDGEALALLLQHYLVADSANGHQKAIKVYSDMRRPRLQMVYKKAQELAAMKEDMGIAMEFIMYFFIWFFSKSSAFPMNAPLLTVDRFVSLRQSVFCEAESIRWTRTGGRGDQEGTVKE